MPDTDYAALIAREQIAADADREYAAHTDNKTAQYNAEADARQHYAVAAALTALVEERDQLDRQLRLTLVDAANLEAERNDFEAKLRTAREALEAIEPNIKHGATVPCIWSLLLGEGTDETWRDGCRCLGCLSRWFMHNYAAALTRLAEGGA